jgi:hypothetical protein
VEQSSDIVKNIVELRESLKIFDQRLSQLKDTIRMVDQNNIDRYSEIKEALQDLSESVSSDKSKNPGSRGHTGQDRKADGAVCQAAGRESNRKISLFCGPFKVFKQG